MGAQLLIGRDSSLANCIGSAMIFTWQGNQNEVKIWTKNTNIGFLLISTQQIQQVEQLNADQKLKPNECRPDEAKTVIFHKTHPVLRGSGGQTLNEGVRLVT